MIACPKCQTANPDQAQFCMNCGSALTIACPKCGMKNPAAAKFCQNCGTSLLQQTEIQPKPKIAGLQSQNKVEGERRILTILFCDVAGSTSMAEGFDPEEWTGIMNRVFPYLLAPIEKYQGTAARLMGDAVLAFFGAPTAHEDDPQRAILAGLEILEGIQELRRELKADFGLDFNLRVGINTGLVVVGLVGGDQKREYTAMGDAVNLAARMEQTAQPGTVQIAEDTYRSVASLFNFQALGEMEVKGKKEPIRAYRVLGKREGALPTRGVQGLHSPLVGREVEFTRLQDLLKGLVKGQGAIVSLTGEAGLGKSRLMAELYQWVQDQGWLNRNGNRSPVGWYEGRSLSYEVNTPYAPVIDMLNRILPINAKQPYEQLKQQLSNLGITNELAPFLAALTGVEIQGADAELVKYLTPPQLRGKIHAAIIDLIACLSEKQKLVLVFEDLHWTDNASLALIDQLLSLTEHAPLLILGIFRPNRQDPSWQFHQWGEQKFPSRYISIQLQPLDEAQSRTLVSNLLVIEDLPERVRLLILKKAEGNPFYVEEVIRSLLDSRLVIREDNHWRAVKEIDHIDVPDTLAGVITTRLDRLGEEERRVLQEAAVIGREFPYDVLASIHTPIADQAVPLADSLATLQRRELICEKSGSQGKTFSFKHVLTQETAYQSILLSKRRQLNLKIAETLESRAPEQPGEIARHFYEAREFQRALPYLIAAGNQAARTYASTEAISYYQKALEALRTVKDPELARQAYEGLGHALSFANRVPEAVENYQAMAALGKDLDDIPMQVSALNKLSNLIAMRLGQFPEAENLLGNAEQLARSFNDKTGLAELFMIRCSLCTAAGDFHGAIDNLSESVEISRSLDRKTDIALGLAHIANTQTFMTEFEKAWQTAQQGLEISRQIGNLELQAEILSQTTDIYYMRAGDYDSAYWAAEEAARIAHRIGAAFPESMGAFLAGRLSQEMGDFEKAIHWEEEAFQAGQAYGMPFLGAMALCTLGAIYQNIHPQKFRDKILDIHKQALELIDMPGGTMAGGAGWFDLGLYALSLGGVDTAKDYFQKGLTIPTPQMLIMRPDYLIGLGLCSLHQGDFRETQTYLDQAREYSSEKQMVHVLPLLEWVQGKLLLAEGKLEAALGQFQKSELLAGKMHMRPLIRQARASAAETLEKLGQSEEAGKYRDLEQQITSEIASIFQDPALRQAYLENIELGEAV